ncbi:hypothetical protein B0H17DRAFT_1138830 [Mycena rosella]|uniref:Uncharacterized protein n=1 Tax=Mycena rosella TaxID=1033263 RepID=A0AAD7D662_MYCRO|nr:hypothetical protein B0H17DRAFT_1138830 [Mycena rosella]
MPSSQALGDPGYRRQLGDTGLVLRWSTSADRAGCILLSCIALGLKEGEEQEYAVRYLEPYTDDAFYSGSSTNWALCVDTTPLEKPSPTSDSQSCVDLIRAEAESAQERVVALVFFLPAEFSFEGDAARVPVGRAHIVACKAAYRQSQLKGVNVVKSLFEMVHARALSTACAFMVVSGIPTTASAIEHRAQGYEYALDMGRGLVTHVSALRPQRLPALERLVTAPRATADIFMGAAAPVLQKQLRWLLGERPAGYTFPVHPFFVLEKRDAPDAAPRIVAAAGLMNSDAAKAAVHPLLWDGVEDASAVALAVVRQLILALEATLSTEKLATIRWVVTDAHPLRRWLLAHELAIPVPDSPRYAASRVWWAAIPSLPAFLRALAPALTARLACASHILGGNYAGALRFAGGVVLRIAGGNVSVEVDALDTSLPRGALIQLLLGYAAFPALQALFPDAVVEPAMLPLVEVLFPPREGVGATMVGAHYVIQEGMVFN